MVRRKLMVPAAATRKLQLAGGQPMEQAVPEDYFLASMALRAIEGSENRNVEFLLKGYLPILLVPTSVVGRYCFIEEVGITSESLRVVDAVDAESVLKALDDATTPDSLLACISAAKEQLDGITASTDKTFLGLMSGLLAPGVARFIERPSRQETEDYSLLLPSIVGSHDLEDSVHLIRQTTGALVDCKETVDKIVVEIERRIETTVNRLETEASPALSRLDQRISSLEAQIEKLESEIVRIRASPQRSAREKDVLGTLDARRAALQRDLDRRESLLAGIGESSRGLLTGVETLKEQAGAAKKVLDRLDRDVSNISVTASLEPEDADTVLLVPFFLAGYSKKGLLQIVIFPPSNLDRNDHKIGRRRDFVDTFVSSSHAIDALCAMLEEHANSDVGFRKQIRELSGRHNLLSLRSSRKLILDGARFLVADGLLKPQLLDELEKMVSSVPEAKLRKRIRRPTISPTDGSTCRVRFHIHDESGRAVDGADVEIGALVLECDRRGIVETFLPKSRYDGTVKAAGFADRQFEFVLDSIDDVTIPIVLTPLSHEEQMAARLDELVERARRLDVIRERLSHAFEEQGQTLLSIPAYRSALSELLTELGYEPESWFAEAKKQQGMVKRLLKRDDRRDALRRDILHIAEDSKQAGGIMLLSELLVHLDDLGWETDNDEVESIVEEMAREGLLPGLSALEGGALIVQFVPVALTDDPQLLLGLAADREGRITIEDAVVGLNWTEERVRNAVALLVETGVAKEQRSYSKSTQYWFPGLRREKK
jgi:hypothetical protein